VVLHHVAVCCSVLQGVAVCCSVLQCVAVCCTFECIKGVKSAVGVYISLFEVYLWLFFRRDSTVSRAWLAAVEVNFRERGSFEFRELF